MTNGKTEKAAIAELRIAINPHMPFDQIAEILKQTLTVPELPGFRGCRPCLSGLDRLVIEDIAMKGMR